MIRRGRSPSPALPLVRRASVAGTFYPRTPEALRSLVDAELDRLPRVDEALASRSGSLVGLLVPHAGLAYSGLVAAAAWRLLAPPGPEPFSVVVLGTNHSAGWLDGAGLWERGSWETPLGAVQVDEEAAASILGLGEPFVVDRAAHVEEHSIEVQLPFLRTVAPTARVVPIAVATGTGERARAAGIRLGRLIAEWMAMGRRTILVASTDMAHYPASDVAESVTDALLPKIIGLDPAGLADLETSFRGGQTRGLVCGMCGIEPAVTALAALSAMHASAGPVAAIPVMAATSADAGGSRDRSVGYLSVAFYRRD